MTESNVPVGSFADTPNQITAARLLVTVGCFAALSLGAYRAALVLFLLAAATDWADGYWARKWGPITKLGRVLDPLADKLLICGVFTYLVAIPESHVAPWMAVVVLARELLVTTLRAVVESSGGDFSAVPIGKWKFVLQVCGAGFSLLLISPWSNLVPGSASYLPRLVDSILWAAVAITLVSGVTYASAAVAVIRREPSERT